MSILKKKYIFEKENSNTIKISSNIRLEVVNNIKLFRDFYRVGSIVYENNDYWVPPFWNEMKAFFSNDNSFWKHSDCILYVAYNDNKPVGRVSAFIDNEFIKENNKKTGFFGFFECINNSDIAMNLLNYSEKWVSNKKINTIIGPIDGRVDLGVGFLVKGFNSIPYLLGHYSHDYYLNFIEKFGMKKFKDLVSFKIGLKNNLILDISSSDIKNKCEKLGIKIREFKRFDFSKEMDWWTDLFMNEFKDHWGYTTISRDDVKNRFGIKELRWIVDPPLFLVAEKDGKPIGFRWSLPDYNLIFKKFNGKLGIIELFKILINKNKINRGRFIIMGIKKSFRGKGIGTILNYKTIFEMNKRGYSQAEYGWIDEDNIASIKAAKKIGGDLDKIYRIFEKSI